MYTRKASLLRANTAVSLLKVCRSSCRPSGSITWLDKWLRNLSTSAKKWDVQLPLDHSSDEAYNKKGFDRESQNPDGFQLNLNPRIGFKGNHVDDCVRVSDRRRSVSGRNSNGFYQNYAGPDRMSFANESRSNSDREIGGFDLYNENYNQKVQRNHTEVYSEGMQGSSQNRNGVYGEMSQRIQNVHSQNETGSYGGSGESVHHQSQNGVYGEMSQGIQQNRNAYIQNRTGSHGGSGQSVHLQNQNGVYGDMSRGVQQSSNAYDQNRTGSYGRSESVHRQNQNGVYGEMSQGIQQNGNAYAPNRSGSYGVSGESVHQRNHSGVYGEMAQGIQHNWNMYGQNRTGSYGGSGQSVHQQNQIQQSSSVSSSYSDGYGFQQQNTGMIQTQNTWNAQNRSWGPYTVGNGGASPSPSGYYPQVQSQDRGSLNWNNMQTGPNPSTSAGQYGTNSDYQNDWSPSQPGGVSYDNTLKSESDLMIEELDAFCREGRLKDAVTIIKSLASKGHVVDLPKLLRLAQLCGEAEALQEAKTVHEHFNASVSVSDISSHNIMIEMYSNCGSVDGALSVFEKTPEKNSDTWYTMIRCLAKNGLGEDAIDMFTRFKNEGNKPDGQVFKGVFYACAVVGDINEGLLHFEAMHKDYGIIPTMEHYLSVVEMLASPGYFVEALDFVEKMPVEPNVDVWETLMNLSRVHGDLELGDRCAELVEQLDGSRLDKQSRAGLLPVKESDVAREKLKQASGILNPLEIRSRVHEFRAGDTAHPDNDKLYDLLRSLKAQMVEMGYVPDLRFVLHDVDPETKEEALLGHSERLAFAQGLLTTPARSTIRVIKNLRVCVDCHNALKLMAKIVGREFVTRDAKRFHHLKDGECSCKDYW